MYPVIDPAERCKRLGSRDRRKAKNRLLARDGERCLSCGEPRRFLGIAIIPTMDNLAVDHVIPIAAGGDNGDTNLQLLCYPCHEEKTAYDMLMLGLRGSV